MSVSFVGCGKAARKLMPRKWKNDINCGVPIIIIS